MATPSTIAALVIAALGVLPGVPGEKCYRLLVGGDFREETWSRVLRLIGFSVFGLVLYIASTRLLRLPFPPYLLPDAFQRLTPATAYDSAIALLGHFVGSALAGGGAALAIRTVDHLAWRTAYGSAWEHFISVSIHSHWVVVGLQNGESYAGYVDVADSKLYSADRDVILLEPARYDVGEKRFRATEYQAMFLPGAMISSIATVSELGTDQRLTKPGEDIFVSEEA